MWILSLFMLSCIRLLIEILEFSCTLFPEHMSPCWSQLLPLILHEVTSVIWIVMLNIVNVKTTSWCQGEEFISHNGSELSVIVPLSP
jgi:hypothetical protein